MVENSALYDVTERLHHILFEDPNACAQEFLEETDLNNLRSWIIQVIETSKQAHSSLKEDAQ